MTKKDYIKIAAVFRKHRPDRKDRAERHVWNEIRGCIADELGTDNPAFDFEKFFEATEVDE